MERQELLLRLAFLMMLYENAHSERRDATITVTFHDGETHVWDGDQMVEVEQEYALEKETA
jgi:hypothetical protein